MRQEKNISDFFDDDFEVIYDETETDLGDTDGIIPKNRRNDRDRTDSFTPLNEYDPEDNKRTHIRDGRRQKRRLVPLAAPIQKGGRALSRITAAVIRSLTAALILAVAIYVTYTFWRASAPYGDILEAFNSREVSPSLAAYVCVAAIFLLFEFISLLWSITRVRVRDGREIWKEDTGRGLFSFILVFLTSYLSFLLYRFLPESPEFLHGLKGAFEVYGSMHNVLFGLCAAGVVSCFIRRYFS